MNQPHRLADATALLAAFIVVLGILLLVRDQPAAPPTAPTPTSSAAGGGETPASDRPATASGEGASAVQRPAAGLVEPITARHGIVAYADPSHGRYYLAIPEGPGVAVRVCGPVACVSRVSTDAGPDKALQRAGRIADVSYRDFATICGCSPEAKGLIVATITYRGASPTLPPTDARSTIAP